MHKPDRTVHRTIFYHTWSELYNTVLLRLTVPFRIPCWHNTDYDFSRPKHVAPQAKNRLTAARSRERKKEMLGSLEAENACLQVSQGRRETQRSYLPNATVCKSHIMKHTDRRTGVAGACDLESDRQAKDKDWNYKRR